MRRGQFYRHENCTDVMIEVLNVGYYDAKRVKLKVAWWVVEPLRDMKLKENIEIKRVDLARWRHHATQPVV